MAVTTAAPPLILIVDDSSLIRKAIELALGRRNLATVFLAENSAEARALFAQHRHDIKLVAMDGNLGNDPVTGDVLVAEMRQQGFSGLIVCISDDPLLIPKMMLAGCNEQLAKQDFVKKFKGDYARRI